MNADELLIFARVVECGSFSAAAQRLGLPKSSVSRRIAALEDALGERLLTRSTRHLAVTEFGSQLFEHAQRLADAVDAAAAFAENRQAEPSGRLRVSMPSDLAYLLLAPAIAEFSRRYPQVELELDLSPRRADLIGESFDFALRMGELPDDATLVARRIATFGAGLVASPGYVAEHGMPEHPLDLARHRALRLLTRELRPGRWRLQHGSEHWEGVPPGGIAANSLGVQLRLALLGAGIAGLTDSLVKEHLASGALLRVLPEWSLPTHTAWAVMPGRRLIPARVRVFIEALREALGAPGEDA